jgi:hypothetical protein
VTFPDKFTKIPAFTFYGTDLEEVVIPKKITVIGYRAFSHCSKLTKITLHASVLLDDWEEEVSAPFEGCVNLKEFVVEKGNPVYFTIDGVLFKKNEDGGTTLIYYPPKKPDTTYTIPENITNMKSYAFNQCDNLKVLYLPKSMTWIFNYFKDCTDLNIMVPETTTRFISEEHIADWPIFNNCKNCYLYVRKNSAAYKYCSKNHIPYKIWE